MICRGFTPYAWQRAVIDKVTGDNARGKTVVCKSRRQCGKSIMIENLLLYYALNYAGGVSAVVSPTLAQARKVFKDINNAVQTSGVIKRKNETLLEMTFINGSQILFKSAEQKDALRGYTIRRGILCIDEAAYISDDILECVLPWVQVHRCPVLMVSSPKFKAGFFWRYFSMGLDEENKDVSLVDWCDFDTSALLTEEQFEMYRRIMPKAQFLSEYEGQFLDEEGLVFAGFRDCIKTEIVGNYSKLYVGIDWGAGGGGDYTVISTIDDSGKQRHVKYWNDKPTGAQIDTVFNFIKENRNRIALVVPETNSIGQPYTDLLTERLKQAGIQVKVEGFNTSNTSKNDIVSNLQVAFENHQIEILDDSHQSAELGIFEMQYNMKTRVITYSAPQGMHDDTCMALAFAWRAYQMANKTGRYTVSVIRRN